MLRYRNHIQFILATLFIITLSASIAHSRTISFAGRDWTVKSGTGGTRPKLLVRQPFKCLGWLRWIAFEDTETWKYMVLCRSYQR
jgi:hypothetical protein